MSTGRLAKVRRSAFATIIVLEVTGVLYFYAHRLESPHGDGLFKSFIFLSAVGTPLIAAALWIEWIQRHRVSYYLIFLTVSFGMLAFTSWSKGQHLYGSTFAAMSVTMAVVVLAKLARPVDIHEQGKNPKQKGQNYFRPFAIYALMLMIWVPILAWAFPQYHLNIWQRTLLTLPAFWFLFRIGCQVIAARKRAATRNTEIEQSS